ILQEALRYDLSPIGLHYLLIHYDSPEVDPADWRVDVAGGVSNPLRLTLDELRARPKVTAPVTLECAGNGRALLTPRPVSQPWLNGVVGTAEWGGSPIAQMRREAGVSDRAVDAAYLGADHGVERGLEQDYERGLPLAEATRPEAPLAHAMNGVAFPVQHGGP